MSWSLTYDHLPIDIAFTVDTVNPACVTPKSECTDIFVRTRAVNAGTSVTLDDMVPDGEDVGDVSSDDGENAREG